MDYEIIDLILKNFEKKRGLKLVTEFKNVTVRFFLFKNIYSMWIDPPNKDGKVSIRLTKTGSPGVVREWSVEPNQVESVLDECYQLDEAAQA